MSLERAFETDELLIQEKASILTGAADPRTVPYARPIGSIYLRTDGTLWQKTGLLANEWSQVQGGEGPGPGTGDSFGNADGGFADSIYGGITPVDGGNASGS